MTAPTGPAPTLFEAIATQRCIEATYNGGQVLLAPHIAFVKHGDLFTGAVTLLRDGREPREEKVGVFKLDGLIGLTLTDRSFTTSVMFDPIDPRFGDGVMIAVEPRAE